MRSRPMPTLVAAALGVVVAASALSGCGAAEEKAALARTPAKASARATPYVEPAGAISDLSDVRCRDDQGVWSFDGTLTNESKKKRTYSVLVAVIKPKTSDVLGQKTFTETVAAGASTSISDQRVYEGGRDQGACSQVVTLDD